MRLRERTWKIKPKEEPNDAPAASSCLSFITSATEVINTVATVVELPPVVRFAVQHDPCTKKVWKDDSITATISVPIVTDNAMPNFV